MSEQNKPTPENNTLEMLSTQADQAGVFGFGRRILVPPDEIHVVVGDGQHRLWASPKRNVYGQAADRAPSYWLNSLTQVVKLKTISFNVPLLGADNQGIEAFDKSKISFRMYAHAVVKLNPKQAEVAAQRIGLDQASLIQTIVKMGTAALVTVAATRTLEEIIDNRQKLANLAAEQVFDVLQTLGYDLALLTITRLDSQVYRRLVQEAEARVTKEITIKINSEQLETSKNNALLRMKEAEIWEEVERKLGG